ncbi:MAG: GtrA family protein [Acidobacteriia bacterium]|nr:GtrA family protein [Terriglobia bacterium]
MSGDWLSRRSCAGTGVNSADVPSRRTWRAVWLGSTGSVLHQFARYLVVGGLAFAADFGSLYLLTEFAGLHYLVSAAAAFLLGLATNYALSRIWVFDRRTMENSAMEFLVFAAIGVVGLGFNEGIIWFVREKIHFHYLVAKLVSAAIVLVWNFGARRWLLFSERPMPGLLRRLAPPYSASSRISAAVAVACLAFCLTVQWSAGAWPADFLGYPDEPAHFVGSVMVRDWLVSGRWFAPLQFARNYYDHYPFFAIGYWPPLFSVVTGMWMLIAGVGRVQSLFVPAVFAAGTGWLAFHLVRRRAGMTAGLCAAAVYLSLPAVRQWMCAVMVDNMTAFLCLAAAVCLLRFLRQPVLRNGILCAVCCACAILSKYSAAYTLALPFLAVVLLRRFELMRKPGLLVQPFVVALLVGPWVLSTRRMAFYGLPSAREALSAKRAASFVLATFRVFPPVLMAVVVLGLIVLLFRPRAWRDDLVVLSLLWAAHLAFLIASPVGAERRYLLMPAAVVLVASFAGWSEMLAWMPPDVRRANAVAGLAAVLTVGFVISQFYSLVRMPPPQIGQVVTLIVQNPARAAQRVVVPPGLEGPVIAEFVAQSRHRPDHYLLRPNQVLAHSDWFGAHYSSAFATAEEMMEYFRQHPVNLVIWNRRAEPAPQAHARIMGEMLMRYPLDWQSVLPPGRAGPASSWRIYQYRGQRIDIAAGSRRGCCP